MGTQNSINIENNENSETSHFGRRLKLINIDKHWSKSSDFMMNHFKENKHNDTCISIECFDDRRLVFVNIRGLFESWRRVPSMLLHTAILLVPLKQDWIQYPSKYVSEIQNHICIQCRCSDIDAIKAFIHLLRWKHSQGLVLWILHELEVDEASRPNQELMVNPLIAHFWYTLSAKLTSLYDHIESCSYKQLIFDEQYWSDNNAFCSKYGTNTNVILAELYFVTMNDNTMQEIIYQSNPKSLHPVIRYLSPIPVDVRDCFKETQYYPHTIMDHVNDVMMMVQLEPLLKGVNV